MSVEAAIQGQFDRIAKGRQTQKAAYATGNDFWTKVDAAADETYENRIKGTTITALDTALANGTFWSVAALKAWFTLHSSYFQNDLNLASPYFTSYLASKGWRVPYEAAEAYYEAMGSRLPAQWVFPKGTLVADESDPSASGMHKFFTWADASTIETVTVVDGALSNCYAPVMITSDTASPGGASHSITATLQDATTKDITYTPDATQYGQIILGQAAIGVGGAAAAQKDVLIKTAVTQFKAGEYVLLATAELDAFEVAQIDSIDTLTLTMESDLIATYDEDDLVIPLFTNAVYKAGTLDTDKSLTVWARPDRIIAL